MGTGGINQEKLDRLFTAAMETAIARIEKDGNFFPLVFEMRDGGVIHNVAMLQSESIDGRGDVLERLEDILAPRAGDGTIQAAAIAVHRPNRRGVEVRLRAANFSQDLMVSYSARTSGLIRRKRAVSLGAIEARDAENRIFLPG